MSAIPMQVLTRPFAVEPVTNIMLPDGIFDNAIYNLRLSAHFTNMSSAALTNVELYLESVGDPGIVPVARTFFFATIPAGASVLVGWNADFKNATPGKRLVSFVARGDGFTARRSIQQIFVSQTRFDAATNTYTCTVEEGTLTVSNMSAIAPGKEWGPGKGDDCKCPPASGPWVPTGLTMAWAPNPAYEGVHGDLPFGDPWWKVLGLIVFVVGLIVGVIAAAAGGTKVVFDVGFTFDETEPGVHCCTLEGSVSAETEFTVAGVASTISSIGLAVACADAADPFYRGQAATPPLAAEKTIGERVVASWTLPEAPNAGRPFTADVKWTYQRFTTGNTYEHSVAETQTNVHLAGDVVVETPNLVHAFDPLWVRAKFNKAGNNGLFTGTDLYAFALFKAPQGLYFVADLSDDGLGFDQKANDGVYSGGLNMDKARKLLLAQNDDVYGLWRVFVFAQDVNLTKPGTPPEIAAQHIGGFFVASAIEITFDPSLPCPLKAQGVITVI